MLRGVSKSGSPCERVMTFFPAAAMCRALVEMAMVRLGWMRSRRSAVRCMSGPREGSRGTYRRGRRRAIVPWWAGLTELFQLRPDVEDAIREAVIVIRLHKVFVGTELPLE